MYGEKQTEVKGVRQKQSTKAYQVKAKHQNMKHGQDLKVQLRKRTLGPKRKQRERQRPIDDGLVETKINTPTEVHEERKADKTQVELYMSEWTVTAEGEQRRQEV